MNRNPIGSASDLLSIMSRVLRGRSPFRGEGPVRRDRTWFQSMVERELEARRLANERLPSHRRRSLNKKKVRRDVRRDLRKRDEIREAMEKEMLSGT